MTMMVNHRPFTDRKLGLYPYSSVQVNLPSILADQIIRWGEDVIHENDIYCPKNDLIHGREDEIHITLLYGIHSQSADEVENLLVEQNSFKVRLGFVSVFTTNDDFDVIKIEACGSSLFHFNQLLKNSINNTPNYSLYRPHVTIAYVKKNCFNNKIIGDSKFNDWSWNVKTVIFSSKNGKKTPIRLNTVQHAYYS
jgi:2'-5' RNA ligase